MYYHHLSIQIPIHLYKPYLDLIPNCYKTFSFEAGVCLAMHSGTCQLEPIEEYYLSEIEEIVAENKDTIYSDFEPYLPELSKYANIYLTDDERATRLVAYWVGRIAEIMKSLYSFFSFSRKDIDDCHLTFNPYWVELETGRVLFEMEMN